MTFALEDSICILPPTKAVWIPPKTPHQARMTNVVEYRSIYFDTVDIPTPIEIQTIDVVPLLAALIDRMAFWEWDKPESEMTKTTELFWEEFDSAKRQSFKLPLPTDRRFGHFRGKLLQEDFVVPTLSITANWIGASPKTVTRVFHAQTGMSFQEWRQQWRLLKSISLLAKGLSVGDTGDFLEFSSDSAFVAFFKKQTGQSPRSYMSNPRT